MQHTIVWRGSTVSAFVVLSALCLPAAAQVPGPGPSSRGVPLGRVGALGPGVDPTPVFAFSLIQKDAVAKELGLTATDRKRLADIVDRLRSEMARTRQEQQDRIKALGPAPDRNKLRQERTRLVQENTMLRMETEHSVTKILGPRQRARLREIQL